MIRLEDFLIFNTIIYLQSNKLIHLKNKKRV